MVKIIEKFHHPEFSEGFVASSAKVHPSAVVEGSLGEDAVVGPNCVVMRGAEIGDGCVLQANVTVFGLNLFGDGLRDLLDPHTS